MLDIPILWVPSSARAVLAIGTAGPPVRKTGDLVYACVTRAPSHCWRRQVGASGGLWVGKIGAGIKPTGRYRGGTWSYYQWQWHHQYTLSPSLAMVSYGSIWTYATQRAGTDPSKPIGEHGTAELARKNFSFFPLHCAMVPDYLAGCRRGCISSTAPCRLVKDRIRLLNPHFLL